MYILFLGLPGAGKGTHARKLSLEYDMFHLSSGTLLRKAARRKSAGGQVIKRYISRGKLVPDEIIVKLIRKEIMKFQEKDIVFEGFPKTINQARELEEILDEIEKEINFCIYLKVDEDRLVYRLTGRRICSNDGSIYHIKENPPEEEGKCDICGANLFRPAGDEEKIVKKRIKAGKKRTAELVEYYKQRINVETVVGTDRSPGEVHQDINEIVEKHISDEK